MTNIIKKLYLSLALISILVTHTWAAIPAPEEAPAFHFSNEDRAELDAGLQELNAAMPEIQRGCAEVQAHIANLPPETFMSPIERFKEKELGSFGGTLMEVPIKVGNGSTEATLESPEYVHKTRIDPRYSRYNDGNTHYQGYTEEVGEDRNIPLNFAFSFKGKDALEVGLLSSAYGLDYFAYKKLPKINDEVLLKKLVEHKDKLIGLLAKLTYDKNKKVVNNAAFQAYKKFINEECIMPSMLTMQEKKFPYLGHLLAQEAMCHVHDQCFPVESGFLGAANNAAKGWTKSFMLMQHINALGAFLSKKAYMIRECYNARANTITLSCSLITHFIFGRAYAQYFNNTHEWNKHSSLSKWILKWAFPADENAAPSERWFNTYWFYLLKKITMHARLAHVSKWYFQELIENHFTKESKKLQAILLQDLTVQTAKTELENFIQQAQKDTFLQWLSFKQLKLERASMLFECATVATSLALNYNRVYDACEKTRDFLNDLFD